jgi:hypothetical protein
MYLPSVPALSSRKSTVAELDIVRDDSLEWRQVFEFRKDTASRKKYQRFVRWLDESMVGKTHRDVIETIERLYNDYLFVLKKHGFEARRGYFETLLNPTLLTAAGTTIAACIAGPASAAMAGVLAAGAIVNIGAAAGEILLTKRGNQLALEELERKNAELAFLHAASKAHKI